MLEPTPIAMQGKPALGYRRTPKVIATEQEFGEALPDIIAGFAKDGATKTTTAGALGYDPKAFWLLMRRMDALGHTFEWVDPCRARLATPYRHTEARTTHSVKALELAKTANAAYWATNGKGTPELVAQATAMRAERLSWKTIAWRLGVDASTLARARRKYPMPDPIGLALQRGAKRWT